MATLQPLPEKPTNTDLANGLMQLHECLEQHKKATGKSLNIADKDRKTLVKQVRAISEKQTTIKTNLDDLTTAFGIVKDENSRKRKPIAFMSQWELVAKIGGTFSIVIAAWRFLDFSFPYFFKYWIAFYHYYIVKG